MGLKISKYKSDLKKHKQRYLYVSNITQKLPEYSLDERQIILGALKAKIVKEIEADCVKNFYSGFLNLNL